MEHFINILVVDDNLSNQNGLKEILNGGGNNVLICGSTVKALEIINNREIGIVIINIDKPDFNGIRFINDLKIKENLRNVYKVALTNQSNSTHIVKALNAGAIDYLSMPFSPILVKAKIEIYKSLYYKDGRIRQLLFNIFPEKVLEELNTLGRFSPKRIENGVVLFTDFVNFSTKAKSLKPMKLLKKLESYFNKFDEISKRYKLEKIKTIGDSYMAIAGVTENHREPEIRACLAAIEMRDYMQNDRDLAIATKKDYWEIRVGINSGPLVAGVIGSQKISFDVWGDTVNVAARAEQAAESDTILVTKFVYEKVQHYFEFSEPRKVEIKKRGGSIDMMSILRLKLNYCLYHEGKIANKELLQKCELPSSDFDHMQKDILNRLKSLLPEELNYHDLSHTTNVEKAAIRLARLEGVPDHDLMLLKTAVYYHDSGFLAEYHDNEIHAIKMANNILPYFGYDESEIQIITDIIAATRLSVEPTTLLEKIMCDADHDYLGRADYYQVSKKLRDEMLNHGFELNDLEWVNYQLDFLENKHQYYTETAKNIRQGSKKARISELKIARLELEKEIKTS